MTRSKARGTAKVARINASGSVCSSHTNVTKAQNTSGGRTDGKIVLNVRKGIRCSADCAKPSRTSPKKAVLNKPAAGGGAKVVSGIRLSKSAAAKSAASSNNTSRGATSRGSAFKVGSSKVGKSIGSAQKKGVSSVAAARAIAPKSMVMEKEKLLEAKAKVLLLERLARASTKVAMAKSGSSKDKQKGAAKKAAKQIPSKATKVRTLKGEEEAVAKIKKLTKSSEMVRLAEEKSGVRREPSKSPLKRTKVSLPAAPVKADNRWMLEPENEDEFEAEPMAAVKIGGDGVLFSEEDIEALVSSVDTLLSYKPSRRQRSSIPDPMTLWGRELHKRPLLTHEQEVELAKRMEKGDEEARRIFIESNYRLVVSIAQKYRGCGVPLEDLIQAGNIGLIQAVDHYDWRQGTRFSTCAVMWIRQAILRAIDSHARIVRLSMRVSEQVHRIAAARQALIRELGRDPTIEEIARRVRLSKERVKELMGYMAQKVISLDDPVDMADGLDVDEVPSFSEYLADDLSNNPEEVMANREMKQVIEEAIRELPDRTQQALKLRFGLDDGVMHTYDEIGYQLGLSRQRAMQLVQLALQQLREHPKVKMLFPQ